MNGEVREENIVVYEKLRDHILQFEMAIVNETIYMYVTFFALIALDVIWRNWLFVLSFVALIAFQSMINDANWEIKKASLYIRVFFEKPRGDIHWETLHQNTQYLTQRQLNNQRFTWPARTFGSTALALIAAAYKLISFNYKIITVTDTLQIVATIILMGITVYINMHDIGAKNNKDSNEIKSLMDAIEDFRKNPKE